MPVNLRGNVTHEHFASKMVSYNTLYFKRMGLDKFNYKIFPQQKLIIRYYHGTISMPEFIRSLKKTERDSLYDPTFNVINDFRDAESIFKIGEINDFIGYITGHKLLYGKRKSVFLTMTPNQTAFSMMLDLLKHDNLIGIQTFSTLEKAIKWVDLQISDLDTIDKAIQNLKLSSKAKRATKHLLPG